ncbi:BREX-1 system phosphatase PglZ type B [Actinacidiphila sp. ITFR-21]|uniref:BREX-1 system phosphatase PglZ type B n=1 Tax=Actinacidiphila sp. ITFR-21 TaxID=3075199 RepID=UPI00288A110A|nr:BREX-1 system phosphatase PglZ type B [Streptomyces sp. ITFR-21]WNI14282.1 BREX-1 system phosphatase PglZ type B [Streptomyces sp. ITFR-21]
MTAPTVLDALADCVRAAAGRYNRDDKAAPAAVLWADPGGAWRPLIPALGARLPLATLGAYDPGTRTGPAIWLRCLLGGAFDGPPPAGPWVVYLPGVEQSQLRAVESAPGHLRPIAELQFRAAWWQQPNGGAWTPASFLRSQDGLGLKLARDTATHDALGHALTVLAGASVDDLRRRSRIDADDLAALLNPDEVKTLLDWLDDPRGTRDRLGGNAWTAFVTQCRRTFRVSPDGDGPLAVARRLGLREGAQWQRTWQRFAEAPHAYPRIPELLRQARPDQLFVSSRDSWPQDDESAEEELAASLGALAGATGEEARTALARLDEEHGRRRASVWSGLGLSPLASAVGHLNRLAGLTGRLPAGGSVADFAAWYAEHGWQADEAAVSALAAVPAPAARDAVGAALRSVYLPWLDETARRFQAAAVGGGYPGEIGLRTAPGECVVFVDGLRYDVGTMLRDRLRLRGLGAEIRPRLAPFPTVTGTGKPAVAPVELPRAGGPEMTALGPQGRRLAGDALRAALRAGGVQPLGPEQTGGDPSGRGWTEAADLDRTGHGLGLKLVDRIGQEVEDIAARVQELLHAGWTRVSVVTDHGWLLVPGGLPKVDLPEHLTAVRKPRAARLAASAHGVGQPTVPWSWDASVAMASPHGVAAFEAGRIYDHGGLSPQECVVPVLVVTPGGAAASRGRIGQVAWSGTRCRVDVADVGTGSRVEVRRRPADPASRLAGPQSVAGAEGEVELLVADGVYGGSEAYVVLLSADGEILAQAATRVGG